MSTDSRKVSTAALGVAQFVWTGIVSWSFDLMCEFIVITSGKILDSPQRKPLWVYSASCLG